MMTEVSSFYCIQINESVWENSTCTCKDASKHYKCFHIIILSAKLELYSFEAAAMRKPLTAKPKRGAKKMSKNCLDKPDKAPRIFLAICLFV